MSGGTDVKLNDKKRLMFSIVMLLITLAIPSAVYFGFTVYRTAGLYNYVKSNQRGWTGHVHKVDAELGFAPVPNSQGAHVFPIGPDIPMRYDSHGFRVPMQSTSDRPDRRPVILALGCSFTYGDATYAEDTFPFITAEHLGGTALNAGVCSYGLSQMLVLARKIVPRTRPDYLLVQYSTWLVDRSISPFASSFYGKMPSPYFYRADTLSIEPPAFRTVCFDLPIDGFRNRPIGINDFFSFLRLVGIPLFVHDDFEMILWRIKKIRGSVPRPAQDKSDVIRYVYAEFAKLAAESNAKLVIVVLGVDHNPVETPTGLFPGNAIVVNAHQSLIDSLQVVTETEYEREYAHWRGVPKRNVDYHPNERAHRIIAEAIVHKILSDDIRQHNMR